MGLVINLDNVFVLKRIGGVPVEDLQIYAKRQIVRKEICLTILVSGENKIQGHAPDKSVPVSGKCNH